MDYEAELDRLQKEKKKLEGEVKRVKGKLSNEGFVQQGAAEGRGGREGKAGKIRRNAGQGMRPPGHRRKESKINDHRQNTRI